MSIGPPRQRPRFRRELPSLRFQPPDTFRDPMQFLRPAVTTLPSPAPTMEAIPGDRPPPPRTGRGPTELEDTGEVGAEAAHMAEAGVEGAGTVGGMGDTEGNGRLAPVLQRASGPLSQG